MTHEELPGGDLASVHRRGLMERAFENTEVSQTVEGSPTTVDLGEGQVSPGAKQEGDLNRPEGWTPGGLENR